MNFQNLVKIRAHLFLYLLQNLSLPQQFFPKQVAPTVSGTIPISCTQLSLLSSGSTSTSQSVKFSGGQVLHWDDLILWHVKSDNDIQVVLKLNKNSFLLISNPVYIDFLGEQF